MTTPKLPYRNILRGSTNASSAHPVRHRRRRAEWLATLVLLGVSTALRSQSISDGKGAFTTHRYPNLLRAQHHSATDIQSKIDAAYHQLFHGDPATQAIYYASGSNANGPLAYVTDIANHDARTEGMSYGMMIAVQLNHKTEFDALWNWANTYMLITDPANPSVGYFAWSMNVDGTPRSDSPAPDGEEYFAMSLYFAAHRWGNGVGIYDYQAQADRILSEMRHHGIHTGTSPFRIHPDDPPFLSATHPSSPHTVTIGPMVDEQHAMVLFVPSVGTRRFTDPSYHLPAFYELWSRWGPLEDRVFWARAAQASRDFFPQVVGSTTGLSPDYATFEGKPQPTDFNAMSINFSYDSWRTASNWSVDSSWWHKDSREDDLSHRIQDFLRSQGPSSFADQYTVDGQPLSTRHSTGMVATTATASLATGDTSASRVFLKELWDSPIPQGEQRYYDGLLYLMSLLHCSGQFRIW